MSSGQNDSSMPKDNSIPPVSLTPDASFSGSADGMETMYMFSLCSHLNDTPVRSCPGNYLADNFLFIVIASTLAAFTISPAVDDDGNPIAPSSEYNPALGGIW